MEYSRVQWEWGTLISVAFHHQKDYVLFEENKSMVYISVKQSVKDYKNWRPFFDNDATRRKAGGATGSNQIYRDVEKPNDVMVVLEWDNKENAQKFAADPALREVMEKAGVIGMPSVTIQDKV
jgi:hypothetical protein